MNSILFLNKLAILLIECFLLYAVSAQFQPKSGFPITNFADVKIEHQHYYISL